MAISTAKTRFLGKVTPAMANAALAAAEATATKSPSSVLSIPTSVRHGNLSTNMTDDDDTQTTTAGAVIRGVGTTRRIFVLNPTFTTEELDGLAHRIQILGRNSGLNSILISNVLEGEEENIGLPTMACDLERPYDPYDFGDDIATYQRVPFVSNGCDPRALASLTRAERQATYQAMRKLALSIRGGKSTEIESPYHSKIPTVSVVNGSLTDGGYLLGMGSYALATGQTRFEILNPARGLALDPIGLSYILPRCGEEYKQPSHKVAIGKLMALTGAQADGSDLVQSGLFTHYMGSMASLGMLERLLSDSIPYNQQNLQIEPTKIYGGEKGGLPQPVKGRFQKGKNIDVNAHLRNLAVANIIHNMSEFDAAGQDYTSAAAEKELWAEDDPSLVLEHDKLKIYTDRESNLLNIAAAFHDVLEKESSVKGVLERMREYAAMDVEGKDEEEVEFVEVSKKLVEGMESRSPLALSVVWELLQAGGVDGESLQSCMEREEKCQLNLLEHDDFKRWIESGADEEDFKDWTHSSLKDVTKDEVREILGR